jgi:fluoroacetyl-CoA thioesterase
MKDSITIGATAEARLVVGRGDTAAAISLSNEDSFPEVFATSRMIALMELSAAQLMRPLLTEGQLSVGVSVNVRHTAASQVGCTVRAKATYLGPDGKMFRFKVEAFDPAGPIGDGDHVRAIIATDRLLAGAERRRG